MCMLLCVFVVIASPTFYQSVLIQALAAIRNKPLVDWLIG